MSRQQNTIGQEVWFEGVGIHTGSTGKICVCPSEPNTGIVFDFDGVRIPALWNNVVSTKRSTSIGNDKHCIATVEHLMSAFSGLNIDNAVIKCSQAKEIPILDGSSLPFCKAFLEAGIVQQIEEVEFIYLTQPVFASSGDSLVVAMPDSTASFEGAVNYDDPEIGIQRYRYSGWYDYVTEVAPARTFGFWKEVQQLQKAGLGLGGDLSNALIYGRPDHPAAPGQRFVNEPVRHKVLDLMGDIALLGRPLCAFVVAIKAGHALHLDFVRKIAKETNLC